MGADSIEAQRRGAARAAVAQVVGRLPFEIHASSFGHSRIDFSRTKVRKELRSIGRLVARDARALVARRKAGSQYPGRRTGALFRAIKSKDSRSGFAVTIAPFRTAELMRKGPSAYYPGFLLYGAERRKRGGALHPRENYIEAATLRHQGAARARLSAVLQTALVPRE